MTIEVSEAFSEIAKLEKDFAAVELDALRQKEYASRELYQRRSKAFTQIPDFWPTVLGNGPQELQAVIGPEDGKILASIKSFTVEHYQIRSDTEGEPRSVRLIFEFDASKNPFFEDTTVVKDFEYVAGGEDGPNGFVSKPVNFKWTKTGKKEGLNKSLDLAEQLYQAEQALVSDKTNEARLQIEQKERESLWQYEKLREEMEKQEADETFQPSLLDFFAYRGVVGAKKEFAANGGAEEEDLDEDEDDEDDYLLDVEVFPIGEELVTALAEDVWENAMDYFMQAQAEDDLIEEMDEDSDEDQSVPDLVPTGAVDTEAAGSEQRPNKKQKTG